ncbi:unnamed protein product [Kuraishia capsulata CBS 1993]|uniref:Uncharacterized protein n=1 Tax=Kuraishia capsulata CBS 1993 TaxID=1382522 RepID=W6MPB2_9ASCO|nr:uncharacterized protein KUCA_T00002924001 [Kuraishia capsulata CBS 1993]CDK26947.1 unnamed protein product [Kuraishia capsulata CBS 1993]
MLSQLHISFTVLGIIFAIIGNFLISLSLNIQKQAHQLLEDEASPVRSENDCLDQGLKHSGNYLRSWRWWTGFLLMTLGEIGNFVAYGLAPVSIVTPLGVVTIISNSTFVAPVLFKEKIRRRDILGTFIAALGVVMMVLSTLNNSGESHGRIDDPFKYVDTIVLSSSTLIYIMVTSSVSLVLVVHVNGQDYSSDRAVYLISHLTTVALFGAYTALATKLLSTIVEFASWYDVLTSFRSYTLLLIIILTSALQIRYLNDCLRVASATTVVPIHFVFFTISVLIGSTITFHDFQNRSLSQLFNFCVGCGLTFLGVFCICGEEDTGAEQEPLLESIPSQHLTAPHILISGELDDGLSVQNGLATTDDPHLIRSADGSTHSAASSIVSVEPQEPTAGLEVPTRRALHNSKSVPDLHERNGRWVGNMFREYSPGDWIQRRSSLSHLVTEPMMKLKKTRTESLSNGYYIMSGSGGLLLNTMLSTMALQPTTEDTEIRGSIV